MAKSLDLPVLSLAIPNIEKINTTDTDNISCLWTVFTKCKDNLEHGKRLENLSWRLWYRERSAATQTNPPVHPVPIQQTKQEEDHFNDNHHHHNAKHVSSTSFKRLISSFDDKIRPPITRLNSLPNELPSQQQRNEDNTTPASRAKKFFIRDDDDDDDEDDDEYEDIYEQTMSVYHQQQQHQSEHSSSMTDNKITSTNINNTEQQQQQQQQQNQATFLPVSSCGIYQNGDIIMNNNMYECAEVDHVVQIHDATAATKSQIDDNKMTHNLVQNTNHNKNNSKGPHLGFKVGKKHQHKRKSLVLTKHQQHVYKWSPPSPINHIKKEEEEEEEVTKKPKLDQRLDFSKQKPNAMIPKGPSLLSNMFNMKRFDSLLLQPPASPQSPAGDELSCSIRECVAWEYRQNNLIYPSVPFTLDDKVMEGTYVW